MTPVSIIMLACNRPKHLFNALRSWKNIDYQNFDFLVVDNASGNPEVETIVRGFSIDFIREDEWHNMNVLWNKYGQASRGEYVIFAMQDEIISHKDIVQEMIAEKECRSSVFTYFMSEAQTRQLEELRWQDDPTVIPLPETDQTSAGLISHVHGNYRKNWDYFGWFRSEENGHLWLDQDVHLREVVIRKTTATPSDVYCLHQYHKPPVYRSDYTQPGFHYANELQARLLEPAERDEA